MWLSYLRDRTSLCCSLYSKKNLTVLFSRRCTVHKTRQMASVACSKEESQKLLVKSNRCKSAPRKTVEFKVDSNLINNTNDKINSSSSTEPPISTAMSRAKSCRNEENNNKSKQKEEHKAKSLKSAKLLSCERKELKSKSSVTRQKHLEKLENTLLPTSKYSLSEYKEYESSKFTESPQLTEPEEVAAPQFTEKALAENDIRLGMRLLMLTYINENYHVNKSRHDKIAKEREKLEDKLKSSYKRLEMKTLNSEQLLSKEGNRIGDGILPLFVKPKTAISNKFQPAGTRSWMDLNPVAASETRSKKLSEVRSIDNLSDNNSNSRECDAVANRCCSSSNNNNSSSSSKAMNTDSMDITDKTIRKCKLSLNAMDKDALKNRTSLDVVTNFCVQSEDATLMNENFNNHETLANEELLELGILEDLSEDTFKDASLETLCEPDLSVYNSENDIRVNSKVFLQNIESKKDALASSHAEKLQSLPTGQIYDEEFKSKDELLSHYDLCKSHPLSDTLDNTNNDTTNAKSNSFDNTVNSHANINNWNDSKLNNATDSTLVGLLSVNATTRLQAQLWERLVEENEDEDFSVASYAGIQNCISDNDDDDNDDNDNNISDKHANNRVHKDDGDSFNSNSYDDRNYDNDYDDAGNDNEEGKDDIY